MKTMSVSIKEMESKKRILEEAVDTLNEDIAKLKAEGKHPDIYCKTAAVNSQEDREHLSSS